MSGVNVWFVVIDANGKKGRPATVPPSAPVPPNRVTTIHIVNCHSEDHKIEITVVPPNRNTGDILIDVPKM